MRTIAANANQKSATVGEFVSRRYSPTFFEHDDITLILPFLQEGDLGAGIVLDENDRLAGLLTERAILRRIFACSSAKVMNARNVRKYIEDMRVEDVMIRKPETLDDTMTLDEAVAFMQRRGYRYMPVVSRADRTKVLGILGERELSIHLQERALENRNERVQNAPLQPFMRGEPRDALCMPDHAQI
jgi:CBS domain-containing protein